MHRRCKMSRIIMFFLTVGENRKNRGIGYSLFSENEKQLKRNRFKGGK